MSGRDGILMNPSYRNSSRLSLAQGPQVAHLVVLCVDTQQEQGLKKQETHPPDHALPRT